MIRPIGGTAALQWDGVSRTAGAGADGWHAVPAEYCRMRAAISTRKLCSNSVRRAGCGVSSPSSPSSTTAFPFPLLCVLLLLLGVSLYSVFCTSVRGAPRGRFEFGCSAGDVTSLCTRLSPSLLRRRWDPSNSRGRNCLLSCMCVVKPARPFQARSLLFPVYLCVGCDVLRNRATCVTYLYFSPLGDHTYETF